MIFIFDRFLLFSIAKFEKKNKLTTKVKNMASQNTIKFCFVDKSIQYSVEETTPLEWALNANEKPFIKMLAEEGVEISVENLSHPVMEEMIVSLCTHKTLMLRELAYLLDRTPDGLRNNYLAKLLDKGKIKLKYPNQVNHPKQAYIIVKQKEK